MKKIILALAVVVLAILTVFVNGCKMSYEENLLKPDMCFYLEDGTRIDCAWKYKFFYVVDKTSGAVYICYNCANRRGGITAAINPDGTHMTVDQLKEIYKHNGTW